MLDYQCDDVTIRLPEDGLKDLEGGDGRRRGRGMGQEGRSWVPPERIRPHSPQSAPGAHLESVSEDILPQHPDPGLPRHHGVHLGQRLPQ